MKNCIIILAIICATACKTSQLPINYKFMINEKQERVYQGIIDRKIIEADTNFTWFTMNLKNARANKNAVDIFKQHKKEFKLLVFGGTWCEDTQNLLPNLYKLVDASEYPAKRITLVGVDRQKNSGNGLNEQYKITNVPTFIVLDNDGKELGRVVEYGRGDGIDVEIAEIVSKNCK